MNNRPLVSIITPSFNQADYLEATIQSVLRQDHAPIEYLVVDGGSSDGSVEIIHKYADHLAWWVSEKDSGQAEAINKGMAHAKGEIIAWINSDDFYLPGAVSQAVSLLQDNPQLGMVFGDAITIDEHGRPLNTLRFGEWGLADYTRFHIICQPSVFMRRSVLETAGIALSRLLETRFHFMLDHHLWLRIAQTAPVKYAGNRIPSYWAAARHHQSAKNVSMAAGFGRETLELLAWMEKEPLLAARVAHDHRKVTGGAYRLNGRYLLDGGMPGAALRSYRKALAAWPAYTLKHVHRIAYAFLALSGASNLVNRLLASSQARKRRQAVDEIKQHFRESCAADLSQWPGISFQT